MLSTDQQHSFLADHVRAVLANGRGDGSPRQAMVGYPLDVEGRSLISTWSTALRTPS